ncbi:MAG: hypothetical protein M3Y24_01875 [Acidobacteriota bacterium]|nr:hypothetical protein [Acidobacteriota bacterium]
MFGGDGEDVAVGLKDGALSGGRDAGVLDHGVGDLLKAWADFGEISGNSYGDAMTLAGLEVEQVNGAELFVGNGVAGGRG